MKIKKGDQVFINAGKDKGKKGAVLRTIPTLQRVIVEGINIVKRHKKTRQQGKKGQIVEMPASLHVSNVSAVCGACGKSTRVQYVLPKEGKQKTRVCTRCKAQF